MLAEQGIEPFDLVCVNLYPFTSAAARRGAHRSRDRRDDRRRRPDDAAGGGEELRPRGSRLVAGAVRPVLDELRAHGEVTLATPTAAGARGIRDERRLRSGDRPVVRRERGLPGTADADLSQGRRPALRREPAPGGGVLRRARRAARTCSRASSSSGARSSRTTTWPISRARGASLRELDAPGRRDRQACESVRCGGRRNDRGGLGARPRRRSGLGLRLRRGREPAGVGRPRPAHRRAFRRGAARARRMSDGAVEALEAKEGASHPRRQRAPLRDARRAGLQARARRHARAGARLGDRRPRGDARRRRRSRRGAVGRPALRLARLQARLLERDRAREGPARRSESERAR